MRYLKKKIAKANEYQRLIQASELSRKQQESASSPSFIEASVKIEIKTEETFSQTFSQEVEKRKPKRSLGNNVMKNYASAMVNFALSRMAEPYLARCSWVRGMPPQMFRQLLSSKKRKTNSIKSFRELLVVDEKDCEVTKVVKSLFRETSKVFLKHFSVNWIYNSKLNDKQKYLKYRMKLYRRVENPEQFTYLESFSTKKSRNQKSPKSANQRKTEKLEG